MEFLLRFRPLKQKVTYLRTEKSNFPSVSLMATIIIETIITDSIMESNLFTTLSGRNMFKIISPPVGLHKCELKLRRLNTKQLPRSRSEETTPNPLGKEIEIKVVLKAKPVSQ